MRISMKPHARLRMRDRKITLPQITKVLEDPVEIVAVRFGRFASYSKINDRLLVVIYEKKERSIEVVTVLWADSRRLRRLGFSGI